MTVSFPSSVASVAVVATLAVQCAGGPAVSTAGTVPLAAAPMRCHEARWSSCLEKPPLPCGGEAWEQEVAMRPAARAAEVRKAARDTLLKRLCRPTRVCAALDAHIHVWQTAQGPGNRVCAQALIRRRDHQRWLKTHTGIADLPAQLSKVAGELRAQGHRRIAVSQLVKGTTVGGPRAVWLARLLEHALTNAGATLKDPPEMRRGRWPKGIDLVVDGTFTRRTEQQRPILVVQWQGRDKRGNVITATPLKIAEAAAPSEGPQSSLPRVEDGAVALRIDTGPGGRLCAGTQTELHLEVDQPLHVAVLDLFDDTGLTVALLALQPGQVERLGPYVALPSPKGGAETFVVVSAPTRAGLGWLADLPERCRLTEVQRTRLLAGDPPGAKVNHISYRVVDDPSCPLDRMRRTSAEIAADVEARPVCR